MIARVERFRDHVRHAGFFGTTSYHEVAVVSDFDADRAVSWASYREDDDETWSVWDVGTAHDHRRRGLASACMLEIMRRARSRGVKTIWLHSERDAIPFYRSLGFTAPYGLDGEEPIMEVSLWDE